MPSNVDDYTDYFRQLAVTHNVLQHDVLTEQGKGDVKRKSFCTFGNNEVIEGLRSAIGKTALLLEIYDNNLANETIYDIRQKPQGAFMVVNMAIENNYPDEQRAYAQTEVIMFDILKQIWQQHYGEDADRCTTPFQQFNFTGSVTPTGKLFTNYYGWYYQFEFKFQNTFNITEKPVDGTFLNP